MNTCTHRWEAERVEGFADRTNWFCPRCNTRRDGLAPHELEQLGEHASAALRAHFRPIMGMVIDSLERERDELQARLDAIEARCAEAAERSRDEQRHRHR